MKKTEFETLRAEWYGKLKDSGFKDIENKRGSVGRGAPRVDNIVQVQQEAILEYYSMARQFLVEHEFTSDSEKLIWSLHAEGDSARDISDKLCTQHSTKLKKTRVWEIVKALETAMRSKYMGENQ